MGGAERLRHFTFCPSILQVLTDLWREDNSLWSLPTWENMDGTGLQLAKHQERPRRAPWTRHMKGGKDRTGPQHCTSSSGYYPLHHIHRHLSDGKINPLTSLSQVESYSGCQTPWPDTQTETRMSFASGWSQRRAGLEGDIPSSRVKESDLIFKKMSLCRQHMAEGLINIPFLRAMLMEWLILVVNSTYVERRGLSWSITPSYSPVATSAGHLLA